MKVSAVDVGLAGYNRVKDLYDAVTDPNEIYQQEIFIVISCACEALEAMTKRYQRGQNRSIKGNCNVWTHYPIF